MSPSTARLHFKKPFVSLENFFLSFIQNPTRQPPTHPRRQPHTRSTTITMNIKAFFEVTPLEQWSVTELRKWLRTSTSPLPAKIPRMFQQELQNIREKIEPYTDAPQEWRSKAARLLPGPPNPKFRRRKVTFLPFCKFTS